MHFNDDNYAAYQLGQCSEDQRKFNDPLTIISLVASAIVFTLQIRHGKYRRFPDNTFTVTLYDRNARYDVRTAREHAHQRRHEKQSRLASNVSMADGLQSTSDLDPLVHLRCCLDNHLRRSHDLLELRTSTDVPDAVALDQIVVRQVPAQQLAKHTNTFYVSLLLIPSAAVVACWSFGGYGPFPGLDNCWINQGIDRFLYFHTFMIRGVVISLTLGPITGCFLWRAYRGVSDRTDHARIFRVMLIRQVLLACYGFLMSVAFLLGGVNTLILKIDPDAHKTWYVKRTAYAYCMLGAVNFSTLGLFVAIIFFSTKSKALARGRIEPGTSGDTSTLSRAFLANAGAWRRGDLPTESAGVEFETRVEHARVAKLQSDNVPTISRRAALVSFSVRFRWANRSFRSSGSARTTSAAASRNIWLERGARFQAYTSTLLAYTREQLLEGSFISDDSDVSTSSSFSSNRSFLDSRRCGDSLGELIFHTDASGSLPSSPRSAPYYLHEDGDDNTAECSHRRIDLRDAIIHGGGVGTTEL